MKRMFLRSLVPTLALAIGLLATGCAAESEDDSVSSNTDVYGASELVARTADPDDDADGTGDPARAHAGSVPSAPLSATCAACGPLPDPWANGPLPDPWTTPPSSSSSGGSGTSTNGK